MVNSIFPAGLIEPPAVPLPGRQQRSPLAGTRFPISLNRHSRGILSIHISLQAPGSSSYLQLNCGINTFVFTFCRMSLYPHPTSCSGSISVRPTGSPSPSPSPANSLEPTPSPVSLMLSLERRFWSLAIHLMAYIRFQLRLIATFASIPLMIAWLTPMLQ